MNQLVTRWESQGISLTEFFGEQASCVAQMLENMIGKNEDRHFSTDIENYAVARRISIPIVLHATRNLNGPDFKFLPGKMGVEHQFRHKVWPSHNNIEAEQHFTQALASLLAAQVFMQRSYETQVKQLSSTFWFDNFTYDNQTDEFVISYCFQ